MHATICTHIHEPFYCYFHTLLPVLLQAGDRVLLPEYGGHTVKIGEEELTLYRDEDILGRFELK